MFLQVASDQALPLAGSLRIFRLLTPLSKTGRHDIAEISLKVALNTNNRNQNQIFYIYIIT